MVPVDCASASPAHRKSDKVKRQTSSRSERERMNILTGPPQTKKIGVWAHLSMAARRPRIGGPLNSFNLQVRHSARRGVFQHRCRLPWVYCAGAVAGADGFRYLSYQAR